MGNNNQVEWRKGVLAHPLGHLGRLGGGAGTSVPISEEDKVATVATVEEEDCGLYRYGARLGGAAAFLGERTAHPDCCVDPPRREGVFDLVCGQ